MNNQERIAIVVQRMVKSGSQRWIIEILKAHKKYDKPGDPEFDLVLINNEKTDWDDFLSDAQHLGVNVIHLKYKTIALEKPTQLSRYLNGALRRTYERIKNRSCIKALSRYKCIIFFEIFLLEKLEVALSPTCKNIVLHVTEHQAQRKTKNPIRHLKGINTRLVFFDRNQITENSFVRRSIKNNDYLISNLLISEDLIKIQKKTPAPLFQKLKIATYTRISPMRFIELQIRALNELLKSTEAELYIYGYVEDDSYKNHLRGLISSLGLEQSVFFEPNVSSLTESIIKDAPQLGWMISIGDAIGYGGIEMMAAGLPCLFISIDATKKELSSSPYISFKPEELARKTLESIPHLDQLMDAQINYVTKNFVFTQKNFETLRNFYLSNP